MSRIQAVTPPHLLPETTAFISSIYYLFICQPRRKDHYHSLGTQSSLGCQTQDSTTTSPLLPPFFPFAFTKARIELSYQNLSTFVYRLSHDLLQTSLCPHLVPQAKNGYKAWNWNHSKQRQFSSVFMPLQASFGVPILSLVAHSLSHLSNIPSFLAELPLLLNPSCRS